VEEQRIGMMYLNLFQRWLEGIWDGLFPRGLRRSRWLPIFVIILIIALPVIAWQLHRMGRFGALKREVTGQNQLAIAAGPRPGGLDPIVLTREQTPGSNSPQFRSVTILPGLGMEILQIRAYLPGKGEVDLLSGPSVKELADNTLPARTGPNDRWGAIELPWASSQTGQLTPVGSSIRTIWRGKTIETPSDSVGRANAEGGLFSGLGADSTQTEPEKNPNTAVATFKGTDFDGHWPSRSEISITVTLSDTALDITVTTKNIGDQTEPMGIGWHPRFILPSGQRNNAEIRMPLGEQLDFGDTVRGIPTGRIGTPTANLSRFQSRSSGLGMDPIDFGVVRLRPGQTNDVIAAELRDPASDLGLRLKAIGDTIREFRVTSPVDANYVSMGTQTNFDDPLGKEWVNVDDAIPTLAPGATTQWKAQLEIFSINSRTSTQH
jgi:aldose 1-epimerase